MRRFFLLLTSIGFYAALFSCSFLVIEDQSYSVKANEDRDFTIVGKENRSYYYYFDEKIYLKENKDLILVSFIDASARKDFIGSLSMASDLKIWNSSRSDHWDDDNYYNHLILQSSSEKEIATERVMEIQTREDVKYVSYMMDYDGVFVCTSDEFAVKLRNRSDSPQLEALAKEYGCQVARCVDQEDGIYYILKNKATTTEVIQLASIFYETGLFAFTSPDFFCFNAISSQDPLYSSQWSLHNTGQYGTSGIDIDLETAWEITEGSSDVIVAIMDDGVEITHSDLADNTVSGYDGINFLGNGAPTSMYERHGTAVAGIVGAVKDNGIGVSGVAPDCTIMPIRVLEYNAQANGVVLSTSAAINGFSWAQTHGVDVINCSWHTAPNPYLTTAIQNAAIYGRNSKGCVIVFSSGNDYVSNYATIKYPASLGYGLAVGAISYDGQRVVFTSPGTSGWSSSYGNNLSVVAPGVLIPTTDRAGAYGYNDQSDYFTGFGGTSAAAPHVSGIAALVLSKYPVFSQEEVRKSINRGATLLSGYSYSFVGTYPDSDLWNAEVGYGMANASGALDVASDIYALEYTPGLDFTIINSSSYNLEDVIIDVQGTISGQAEWLISCDIIGGVPSGEQIGYPYYRGYSLMATPGTPITDISVNLFASCTDYSGNLEIGAAFDTPAPNLYQQFSFGYGNSFHTALPDITVPNESRRMIYIRIFDID